MVVGVSAAFSLTYGEALIAWGIVAADLAPCAIHKVPEPKFSLVLLAGLAIFASLPARRIFQLDGIVGDALAILIYFVVFWVIGMGWKRDWK